MKILICQTPRLTYIQAMEFLRREIAGWDCRMAVFPEYALEHPPQCTEQGGLDFNNVALLALSKFALKWGIYIVLGSVEERLADTRVYDTCVVIDPKGEIICTYRKMSPVGNKCAGTEPGLFKTEDGDVGILLGAEVEEAERWAPLLSKQVFLVLNPTRARIPMDVALAKSLPELQIVAWHHSFRDAGAKISAQCRAHPVCLARADAPMKAGGGGTSMLFEPHRSIFVAGWGPGFIAADTTHTDDMRSNRLPGWRVISVEERIKLALKDRSLLFEEESELGPRYSVWTLQLPERTLRCLQGHGLMKTIQELRAEAAAAMEDGKETRSFVLPLTGLNGKELCVMITGRGNMVLWDMALKQHVTSLSLSQGQVTAVAQGASSSQFFVAGRFGEDLTFRCFNEASVISAFAIPTESLPWDSWPMVGSTPDRNVNPDVEMSDGRSQFRETSGSVRGSRTFGKFRKPYVRALFWLGHPHVVFAVVMAGQPGLAPLGLVVDIRKSSVEAVDIYGAGPPQHWLVASSADKMDTGSGDGDAAEEEDKEKPTRGQNESLVGVASVTQLFQERPDAPELAIVCLYQTNRLVIITVNDWKKHEMMLLEEGATKRQREDEPVAATALPCSLTGAFHILVSYKSNYLRWWQASLKTCRQVALSQVFQHRLLQLSATELPSPNMANREPIPVPPAAAPSGYAGRRSLQRFQSGLSSRRSSREGKPILRPEAGTAERRTYTGRGGTDQRVAFAGQLATKRSQKSMLEARSTMSAVPSGPAQSVAEDPLLGTSGCLLIVAVGADGYVPLFIGNMGRLTKVYSCSLDGSVGGGPSVANILPDEQLSPLGLSLGLGDSPKLRGAAGGEGLSNSAANNPFGNILERLGQAASNAGSNLPRVSASRISSPAAAVATSLAGHAYARGDANGEPASRPLSLRPDLCPCQIWCLEKSIVCALSCGDLRHIEITVEDQVVSLKEFAKNAIPE